MNYNIYEPTAEQKSKIGMVETPPISCDFKVGDEVTFTNDFGVSFPEHKIVGFSPVVEGERFIYYNNTAWWFPCAPRQLTKK